MFKHSQETWYTSLPHGHGSPVGPDLIGGALFHLKGTATLQVYLLEPTRGKCLQLGSIHQHLYSHSSKCYTYRERDTQRNKWKKISHSIKSKEDVLDRDIKNH